MTSPGRNGTTPGSSLGVGRYRAYYFDSNDDSPHCCRVAWYRAAPVVGELVVLHDAEHNVMLGTVESVLNAPNSTDRADGWVLVKANYATWLDGEDVLTLAVARLEQTTGNPLITRVSMSEKAE